MFRVKAVALAAIPLVLMAILFVQFAPIEGLINDDLARLIGMLLLAFALLSCILVFRLAQVTPKVELPRRAQPMARAGNEFRRGFASTKVPPRPHRAPRPSEVIAWRRHRIEPRVAPSTLRPTPAITPETIASLKQRLQDRAEQLWKRRAS